VKQGSAGAAKEKWAQIVSKWEVSGKNPSEWCRENGLCYKSFITWRKRLKEPIPTIQESPFVELSDKASTKTCADFHHGELRIIILKDFDSASFVQILQALRVGQC